MKKLVIVGTGLLAEVVCTYFRQGGEYEVVAFAADQAHAEGQPELMGLKVEDFHEIERRYSPVDHEVFVAIGYRGLNRIRARFFEQTKAKGYRCASYMDRSVVTWPGFRLGENVLICEDNTIQPFVTIGDDTFLWSGNHIGHHSKVGSHVFISSHVVISGSCTLGDYSFFGVNATVRASFAAYSTLAEVEALLRGLHEVRRMFA